MKNRFVILALLFITVCSFQCKKNNSNPDCYKGKLAKKALCMNYTLTLVEGNMDPSLYEASWTDPNTGTTYSKAFALASPCTFPQGINEGDEFYFTIEPQSKDCAVCMAFYPTPAKKLEIKVLSASCP